jgi:hypothetical protein
VIHRKVIKTERTVVEVTEIKFEVKKHELKYENLISLIISLDLMICEIYKLYFDLLKRNRSIIGIKTKKFFSKLSSIKSKIV